MYYNFVLYLTILYLAFVPFGSYPIFLFGIKLDLIIAIILFLFTFIKIKYIYKCYPKYYLVSFLLVILVFLLSATLSIDPYFSIWRLLITSGYLYLSIALPVILVEKYEKLFLSFFYAGVLSSFAAIVCYYALNLKGNGWERYTHPNFSGEQFIGIYTDPNILGFGMILSILPFVFLLKKYENHGFSNKYYVYIALILLIIWAMLLTKSRTTILSFIIALFVLNATKIFKNIKNFRINFKIGIITFVVITLIVITFNYSLFIESLFSRFTELDMGRINSYSFIFNEWASNFKTIIIGIGYYYATKTIDPHNVFLETLYGSGLLGLLSLITMVIAIFIFIKNSSTEWEFKRIPYSILIYILVGCMTYWHTKTFWVPVLLINVLILYKQKTAYPKK
jgi:O-antigen ligase